MSDEKRHSKWQTAGKITAWTVGGLVALILLLPAALYIPWVQQVAKNYACRYINRTTGLDVSIGHVSIKFPLDASLDDVVVLDEQRDTMLIAKNLTASIAARPLLDLRVEVDEAILNDAYYRFASEDSSMLLTARVDRCRLKGTQVDLNRNLVNVLDGELTGGRVHLDYRPWNVVYEPDTAATNPWRVNAYHLTLNDIDYSMTMPPTIDTLKVHLARAHLDDGIVDTGERTVDARTLAIDSVDCRYTYYDARRAANFDKTHPLPVDTFPHPASDSIPWRIKADSLSLKNGRALYAAAGARPASAGLDPNYIEVDGVNIGVNNFSNRGTDISMVVSELTGKERCGLNITETTGGFAMNDRGITLRDVTMKTPTSTLRVDTELDLTLADDPPKGDLRLTTDSRIDLRDITRVMPDLKSTLAVVPQDRPLTVKGSVTGSPERLRLDNVRVDLPGTVTAQVGGTVNNVLDTKRLSGHLTVDGRVGNLNGLKGKLLDRATAATVNLPPMALKGDFSFTPSSVSGNGNLTVAGGTMVARGEFNANSEGYDLDARLNGFPVGALLPTMGVGNVTGHVKARGHGFDFTNPATVTNVNADIASITYDKKTYRNVGANLRLANGTIAGTVDARDKGLDLLLDIDGTVKNDRYALDINGRLNQVDAAALGFYDGICNGSATIDMSCDLDMKRGFYNGRAHLTDVSWNLDGDRVTSAATDISFNADDRNVSAMYSDEGTELVFNADGNLNDLLKTLDRVSGLAKEQIANRSLNIDTLQHTLPQFDMRLKMGSNGLIQRYLAKQDIEFRNVDLTMRNDSNVYVDGTVLGLAYNQTAVDTLTLHMSEWKEYLAFKAHMGNRPGTWDEFAQVDIEGGAIGSTVDFLAKQQNIKGETGYLIGANASLRDDDIAVRFFPQQPVIGYRQWEINDSNYVNIDYVNKRMLADLHLKSDESVISLASAPDTDSPDKDDIRLNIQNLKIEEWTQLVPALDDMTGNLDADMHLYFDGRNVEGNGDFSLSKFTYDDRKVGDLTSTARFAVDPLTAATRMNADLNIDGSTVAVAMGTLNDSTAANPFNLALNLKRFPLKKANPFVPGRMVRLNGYLTGDLAVTGTPDAPVLNGFLAGDSAYVTMPRYGASLRIAADTIPVNGNVITLRDFKVYGLNDNPVNITGTVDARNLDDIGMNINLRGRNVQFIGAEQKRYSEVFGKGFADIDGQIRGRGEQLDVNARLALLSTSNITYVMQDEIATSGSTVDENMVRFVNPYDSVAGNDYLVTGYATSALNVTANIEIQQGAKIAAYLSTDGKDRATIEGSGNLKYTLDFAGKDNLTGTYVITGGNVRYSPPVISQKSFDLTDGSTITWTGEMLNPQLDLRGNQIQKSSVSSEDEGSRLVEFDIEAMIGGTLENMDLSFDVEALNDIAVENELQAMSPTQRSQVAINLMLYNSYTGYQSSGTAGLSAQGALFSFLQSQLNSWAASSLKGIDISFGINQYEGMRNSGTQTSYSYRLSKSLFDDRFKIVVGGEYSTDATSEENFSKNLINDISVEYMLNSSGSRYVRLFRHTGYESVLEGQITKTGVGFVMKHKASTLKSLFYPKRNKKTTDDDVPPAPPLDSLPANDNNQPAQ